MGAAGRRFDAPRQLGEATAHGLVVVAALRVAGDDGAAIVARQVGGGRRVGA